MDLQQLQASPAAFRAALKIDADGTTVRLGDRLDDWQQQDFTALDPGWLSITGQQSVNPIRRGWLERPRGHSKTSDIAVQATWALFASRRRLAGYAAAADRDQSRLIRDAIDRLLHLNPWLSRILDVQNYKIVNTRTKSTLEILSSDAPTSYGLLPDFVILDEVTHWPKRDLFDSLFSSVAKRRNCLLISICNAGFSESWAWEAREAIRTDPDWYFSRLDGPVASWISEKLLDEQRRLLPSIAFNRLWLNEWSAGAGDALTADDIDRSITLDGPLDQSEPGYQYYAGVDLGLSRDASAIVVVGRHVGHVREHKRPRRLSTTARAMIEAGIWDEPENEYHEIIDEPSGKLKLAAVKVWKPTSGKRVSVEGVERAIRRLDDTFRLSGAAFDRWQSVMLQERIAKAGIPTTDVPFTSNNLTSMCSAVLEAFSEGQIELYDHPQLVSDLRSLRVVEKSYGVRLDSPRGLSGHGDAATALALALHLASSSNIGLDTTYNESIIAC